MRFSLRALLIALSLLCIYCAYFDFLSGVALATLACAVVVVPASLLAFSVLDLLLSTLTRHKNEP